MSQSPSKLRQVVDWSAVFWAGLISGTIFLLLNIGLSIITDGSPWEMSRYTAATVMGGDVLLETGFSLVPFLVGLGIHLVLSLVFAALIAIVIHRWGLIVGIVGGALFGLAFYAINFFTVSTMFDFTWFYLLRNPVMALSHIIFGALAGGIYEALEVEEFVPAD